MTFQENIKSTVFTLLVAAYQLIVGGRFACFHYCLNILIRSNDVSIGDVILMITIMVFGAKKVHFGEMCKFSRKKMQDGGLFLPDVWSTVVAGTVLISQHKPFSRRPFVIYHSE